MKRWLDWKIVVPRVLMVAVALLAVQYILGAIARSIAIRSGNTALGSRVEVGHARVSLVGRQVVFNDLRIANPSRPAENALEADWCELKFAPGPLLHKQAVVESGRIGGLRFGQLFDERTSTKPVAAWFKDDADQVAAKWLSGLGNQFTLDAVKQLESVERTEAFCANWSHESAALDARLRDLEGRAAEVQQAIDGAQANPLRNDKLLDNVPKKVADLQKDFSGFQREVEKLPDLLENERRSIVAARRRDDEAVSKQLQLVPVDAEALNAYLLREQAARQLDQLVGWLRWMRAVAPADAKLRPRAGRGADVLFAGCRPLPGIIIRSLELEGMARVGGQAVELRGVLTNLASEPKLYDLPIRLRMAGAGSLPVEMQAMIDRTGPTARDELLVECEGILLPAVALGRSDLMEIELAPSVGSLSVSAVVDGDKLSGVVQLVQQQVQITPALHGSGSPTLAAAMGSTKSPVQSLGTRLSLGGTLAEPTCTMQSNVGRAAAETMQLALHRAGAEHSKALLAEAGRRVDERLAEVDRQVAAKQARFANKSTDITARLQRIAARETPRYRISAEPGRRLPTNSLFR